MTELEIVRLFIARINAHDVSSIAALLSPDHRFVDSLGSVVEGRATMEEGWRRYFQMVPDYRIEISRSFTDGDEVVLVGTARGTYSRGGQLNPADAWQTPAAWRARVRDGELTEWQVYADNEPIRRRMEGI